MHVYLDTLVLTIARNNYLTENREKEEIEKGKGREEKQKHANPSKFEEITSDNLSLYLSHVGIMMNIS